jgi:glutamine synthetase
MYKVVDTDELNIEEVFASNVFTLGTMHERLPQDVYDEIVHIMDKGGELSKESANIIAKAMKDWAVSKGATHFTHWFQPLNGTTAEKHDAFVTHPDKEGKMLLEFSGKELIKGEPDASSFPSGGLRSTFEARGYTAWDITSPAFIKESGAGKTLCIPTAFCSYKGEALDKKTPLLRSMEAISTQGLRIVRLFGNDKATKVTPYVGAEQEYFLVDRAKYMEREDLIFTGRTLFGAPAPKGQEMDDHYFGTIPESVGAFMHDLNLELWKMGVTAKTQHNEAAPAQHELAPIYETANIATDHNQLVMETMKKMGYYHGLACLLHEKPFAGVNGSGKHDNWSLCTDNGVNLFEPGDTPNENIQFLLVIACIMKAVDTHAALLRQSAADVGNDHRLGADEAPPAIISIFLGDQLFDVVSQLVETGEAATCMREKKFKTGVSTIPAFNTDVTDRNRTSPFAFTGNKFEFRSVGSSDSIGDPNTVLNTIVAEAFCEAADILEKADDFQLAAHDLIKEYMTKHYRILFNGDGYAKEWEEEAARRGLPNIKSMVEAVDALVSEDSVKLFEKFGIFTRTELESRAEILYERYAKSINIEAVTMIDMANKLYMPAVMGYVGGLASDINNTKAAGLDTSVMQDYITKISGELRNAKVALDELTELTNKAKAMAPGKEQAFFYHDKVFPAMRELRAPIDKLETMVDKAVWPVPTYEELLFEI